MSVTTLTFTGSIVEIVDGIPQQMTISSNVPATIYFTLDNSAPTTDSPIYIDTFNMPDNMNSVVLSAFGVDADEVSGITLTQTFAPNTTRVTVGRYTGSEGFVINRPDIGANTVDGFGADGNAARFVDVDLETLDIIRRDQGFEGIGDGINVKIIVPNPDDTATLKDNDYSQHSTPLIGEDFDPTARVITIDNRLDNDITVMLRPFGSLSDIYTEYGGKRIREPADDAAYVSGGFVRRFYSQENKIMVSYYFDHNEARWITNIQNLPDIPDTIGTGAGGHPLVFPWIYRGKQSSI